MHTLLNNMIGEGEDPPPSHDFDIISHNNCNYKDDGKGINIDVDKILKSAKDEVLIQNHATLHSKGDGTPSVGQKKSNFGGI